MKVSIIIPVLNEESEVRNCLEDITVNHDPDEIIVVDGGSIDKTVQIASNFGKVIHSKSGRAIQMNEGAKSAKGDVLLFLHSDTRLPERGIKRIRDLLETGTKNSGRFYLNFNSFHPLLSFYAFFTRFHFFSYGDQGFFLSKKLFEKIGGFREDVPFEDIDFYQRLLKCEKPIIMDAPVITSSRRFKKVGIIKQGLIDISFILMYVLKLNTHVVQNFKEKWYPDIR